MERWEVSALKGKERKGKERKGKERKGKLLGAMEESSR